VRGVKLPKSLAIRNFCYENRLTGVGSHYSWFLAFLVCNLEADIECEADHHKLVKIRMLGFLILLAAVGKWVFKTVNRGILTDG